MLNILKIQNVFKIYFKRVQEFKEEGRKKGNKRIFFFARVVNRYKKIHLLFLSLKS